MENLSPEILKIVSAGGGWALAALSMWIVYKGWMRSLDTIEDITRQLETLVTLLKDRHHA